MRSFTRKTKGSHALVQQHLEKRVGEEKVELKPKYYIRENTDLISDHILLKCYLQGMGCYKGERHIRIPRRHMWKKGEKCLYWDSEHHISKGKTPVHLLLARITSSFVSQGGLSLVLLHTQTLSPGISLPRLPSPWAGMELNLPPHLMSCSVSSQASSARCCEEGLQCLVLARCTTYPWYMLTPATTVSPDLSCVPGCIPVPSAVPSVPLPTHWQVAPGPLLALWPPAGLSQPAPALPNGQEQPSAMGAGTQAPDKSWITGPNMGARHPGMIQALLPTAALNPTLAADWKGFLTKPLLMPPRALSCLPACFEPQSNTMCTLLS